MALARGIVRLFSSTIPASSGLRIELQDGTAGVPVMSEPAWATLRIDGPDALGRMIWPPTPDSLAEAYLRGDVEIEGDVMAAVASAQALDLRRLAPDGARQLVRCGAGWLYVVGWLIVLDALFVTKPIRHADRQDRIKWALIAAVLSVVPGLVFGGIYLLPAVLTWLLIELLSGPPSTAAS
jgi:hypothetical protein